MKNGSRLKTDGKEFGRNQALGLLWEMAARIALGSGIGSLTSVDLTILRLSGGELMEKVGRAWRKRRWVDVSMGVEDAVLVAGLVEENWLALAGLGFQAAQVDAPVTLPSGKASLDLAGF